MLVAGRSKHTTKLYARFLYKKTKFFTYLTPLGYQKVVNKFPSIKIYLPVVDQFQQVFVYKNVS